MAESNKAGGSTYGVKITLWFPADKRFNLRFCYSTEN